MNQIIITFCFLGVCSYLAYNLGRINGWKEGFEDCRKIFDDVFSDFKKVFIHKDDDDES